MMLRRHFSHRWLCVSTVLGTATLIACGPFFPEVMLEMPRGILQPPLFLFRSELSQIPLPPDIRTAHAPGTPAYTLDLEMMEIEQMVAAQPEREAWLLRYRALRRAMLSQGDKSEHSMRQPDATAAVSWAEARQQLDAVTAPLPEEVRLYLQGAAARIDASEVNSKTPPEKASEIWRLLLALPAEKRTHRSTWAAWMLFRTAPHEEQGHWLAETRRLAQEGCKDCLHLGIEATYILGREGSDYAEKSQVSAAEWKRAAMLRAQLGLSRAETKLLSDRRLLMGWSADFARQVMADPFLRRVQMLQLIENQESANGWEQGRSNPKPSDDLPRWLKSFEDAGIKDQQEAVLLAWISYNAARFDEARRWLVLAPAEDVNALALRGKLAAMRGNRREAQQDLTRMAARLPTPANSARAEWQSATRNEWAPLTTANYADVRTHKLLADCGVAQVARNDFAGALQTFLRTDYWSDAAYIAERLLSVEELLSLARTGKIPPLKKMIVPDREPPPVPLSIRYLKEKYGGWGGPEGIDRFTYLVARRLAREGLIKEACRLLPADLERALLRFDAEMRRSKDKHLAATARGQALWTAAQIERSLGMELFGYEIAPDFTLCAGLYDLCRLNERRKAALWLEDWIDTPKTPAAALPYKPVLTATADELWAARHYAPRYEQRFHYRYTAADHALQAARLMSADQEAAAYALTVAGGWLKNRDPKSADRFYQALVMLKHSVPLVMKAEDVHWFPPVDWSFNLELP